MQLRDIQRRFGATDVLRGVSLDIPEGHFVSLLGPSGCGKSTTLRIIAGLDRPDGGAVLMDGRDVSDWTAARRNVAMVFQSYALYPHLTVAQNIALPLAMREMNRWERLPGLDRVLPSARRRRAAIDARVDAIADLLGIDALLARKPAQLSGGQQQRVAVGRALVREPTAFLLDEPLSNLDAKLRIQMRGELKALHRRTGRRFVYVTHDQAEAVAMSDTVALMLDGRIAQIGPPKELYARPASRAVAGFLGDHPINLIDVDLAPGAPAGPLAGWRPAGPAAAGPVTVGIRPEHLRPAVDGPIRGRLEEVEYLGAAAMLHVRLADAVRLAAIAPGDSDLPAPGSAIALTVEPRHVHLFDRASGRRIDGRLVPAAA